MPSDIKPLEYGDLPSEGISLKPGIKLWVSNESGILGPGVIRLLSFVETFGSLKHAALEMGLSYSKARKIVASIEHGLGVDVVSVQQGGKHGGNTTLTAVGKDLIDRYEAFMSECAGLVQTSFDKHFGEFLRNASQI